MLLSLHRAEFNVSTNRVQFAERLSCFIDGQGPEDGFEPYCPNAGDDTFWRLSRGNNWTVIFYPERPDQFTIQHRYDGPQNDKEAALAGWLVARLGCVIEGGASQSGPFAPKVVLP